MLTTKINAFALAARARVSLNFRKFSTCLVRYCAVRGFDSLPSLSKANSSIVCDFLVVKNTVWILLLNLVSLFSEQQVRRLHRRLEQGFQNEKMSLKNPGCKSTVN